MLLDEYLQNLQKLTKKKPPTYEKIAEVPGIGSKQAVSNRIYRKQPLKEFEIEILNAEFKNNNQSTQNEDCVDIPVRGNLSASLGQGIEIVDETQTGVYSVSRKLMKDVGANPHDTDFIPCEGDSMFPTIEGGSLLMVDRSKKEVFDGKIYCVRLNGNLIAKRLQFIPPNSVKVISDNKEKYDPFYVDLSKTLDYDFEIIGEVKWYGTIVR
jgi:phage repressor protein C with HTH and peptisase S24 domain